MSGGAIRDPEAYKNAAIRRDTGRFDECFPRGCSFGDIDSFLELSGHMLFVEWKVANQSIPTGQRIAYGKLSKLPDVTVVFVWTKDDGEVTHAMRLPDKKKQMNETQLKDFFRRWAAYAESHKK